MVKVHIIQIYIWEQDDYGRTLFSYCEDYGNKVFALVIMQSYDDTNAYFYPDINYRTDYTSKVVKESLAKYFEKEYCEMYFRSSVYYDYLFYNLFHCTHNLFLQILL